MWNPAINSIPQQPQPPLHQQPPQHPHAHHHLDGHNNNNLNNINNNNSSSLHSDSPSLRSKDLNKWCEAFDKHELVDILVKISKTNPQFQSYLGHAFVTDIKWCKIRVTFTASSTATASQLNKPPNSTDIQQHFTQYGNIRRIECFPSINSALITYENYTYAQSAVSVGIHKNVSSTNYDASCCYEFEGTEIPQQPQQQQHTQQIQGQQQGPLEQRRIFVSSLSYSTLDNTLQNVFNQYGELEDCTIVKDKATGRSKGYGFVVFKTVGGALNALKQPEKFIDGRRTRSWLAAQGNQFRNK